jgi:hypothetical protein
MGKYVHLTRRREPENYIHPQILQDQYNHTGFQQCNTNDAKHEINAITQIKRTKVLEELWPHMTAELILEMDVYEEDGQEKHELADSLSELLNLVE